jgi:hypothetical protein
MIFKNISILLLTLIENLFSVFTQSFSLASEKSSFAPISKKIFILNNKFKVCLCIINFARFGIVGCPARFLPNMQKVLV